MRIRIRSYDGQEYVGNHVEIAQQMHESRHGFSNDATLSDKIRRSVAAFGDVHGIKLVVDGDDEESLCRSFVACLLDARLIHRLG